MITTTAPVLSLADIEAARRRLANGLRFTPCLIAPALSELTGIRLWLKREDLQRTGSFKERGARHALLCLDREQRARGVVAASAGNHALGLAYHGAQLGVRLVAVEAATSAAFAATRAGGAPCRVTARPALADGLAVARIGDLPFAVAAPLVDEVVAVTEDEIAAAIVALARRGIVAEGAGAAAFAAVLAGKVDAGTAVLPITGRNIDPRRHEQIVAGSRLGPK